MAFHSFSFLVFLGIILILYYCLPAVCRKWVLLGGSLFFYYCAGWEKLVFFLVSSSVVYAASVWMGKQYERMQEEIEKLGLKGKEKSSLQLKYKKKCRVPLAGALVLMIGALCFCKYGHLLMKAWNSLCGIWGGDGIGSMTILVPLGISYYTFSSVGYLLDIYWRKGKYEKKYSSLLTCMCYFPQMIQGPIARYAKLLPQIEKPEGVSYERFCMGLQLMLWGYFKKLVIADRLSVFVNQVFGHIGYYQGLVFVVALVSGTVQLYADFSGCMDIVEGVSQLFGIRIERNFDHPFASVSIAEFWRRWHVTLGAWFKEYVFFPMATSGWNIKISKFFKTRFGVRAGKAVTSVVPLLVVWFLTGAWHGTGLTYIVWGFYYGILILIGSVFQPELQKICDFLRIDTKSCGWNYFCRLRTFLIFCGGRLLTMPGTLENTRLVIRYMLSEFNIWIFFDGTLLNMGLTGMEWCLVAAGVLLMALVGHFQIKGVRIRERIAAQHITLRWVIYYAALFAVLILGVYGAGYHASEFIYAGF